MLYTVSADAFQGSRLMLDTPASGDHRGTSHGRRRVIARPTIRVRSRAALRVRSSMVRGPIPMAIVDRPPKTPRIPKGWTAVADRRLQGRGVQGSSSPATRTAPITNTAVPPDL